MLQYLPILLLALGFNQQCEIGEYHHDGHSTLISRLFEEAVWRIEGKILGCLIREGMTVKQVNQVLQDGLLLLVAGNSLLVEQTWRFHSCGISVFYESDHDGVFRVYKVNIFSPRR